MTPLLSSFFQDGFSTLAFEATFVLHQVVYETRDDENQAYEVQAVFVGAYARVSPLFVAGDEHQVVFFVVACEHRDACEVQVSSQVAFVAGDDGYPVRNLAVLVADEHLVAYEAQVCSLVFAVVDADPVCNPVALVAYGHQVVFVVDACRNDGRSLVDTRTSTNLVFRHDNDDGDDDLAHVDHICNHRAVDSVDHYHGSDGQLGCESLAMLSDDPSNCSRTR